MNRAVASSARCNGASAKPGRPVSAELQIIAIRDNFEQENALNCFQLELGCVNKKKSSKRSKVTPTFKCLVAAPVIVKSYIPLSLKSPVALYQVSSMYDHTQTIVILEEHHLAEQQQSHHSQNQYHVIILTELLLIRIIIIPTGLHAMCAKRRQVELPDTKS